MSYLLPGKRAKELAAVAAANRLRFTQEDTAACTEIPFTLFVQGTGQAAQNVMTGRLGGVVVRGFDFPYLRNDRAISQASYDEPGFPPIVPYEDGKPYSCALVGVTGDLPFIHIAPRSRKRVLPDDLELTPGRRDLARAYQIWALEPERANHLLSDAVTEILVSTKGKFEFEIAGPGVLSMVVSIKGEDFPGLMAMTVRFAEALEQAAAAAPDAPAPTSLPTPADSITIPDTTTAPAPPVAAPAVAPPAATPSPAPQATLAPAPEPASVAIVGTLPPPPTDGGALDLPPPPPDAESAPLPPPPPQP